MTVSSNAATHARVPLCRNGRRSTTSSAHLRRPAPGVRSADALVASSVASSGLLDLQRRAGNRAVAGAFAQRQAAAAPAASPGTSAPFEWAVELPGPKSPAGYFRLNKGTFKIKRGKISRKIPGSTSSVGGGPTAGGTTKDGKHSPSIAVSAEAKQTAQLKLQQQADQWISSLVQAVTGKDKFLKTELFSKKKAEARLSRTGATNEFSAKWGYEFGIDATVFGVAKTTMSVGFTLAGIKLKKGERPKVTFMAFTPTTSHTLALPFEVQGDNYQIESTFETSAEFEPNWEVILRDLALEVGGAAAVDAAVAGVTIVGPVFMMGSGFLYASERRALDAKLTEGAHDAKHAALVYATILSGSDMPAGNGPRSAKAVTAANRELNRIAAAQGVPVDELKAEIRREGTDAFGRLHGPARQQIYGAYDADVRQTIRQWRDEHWVLSIWTREEDDILAAQRAYGPVLER